MKADDGRGASAATRGRFRRFDHQFLREIEGRRSPPSVERVLRKTLALPAKAEREALIYHRILPAPSSLQTEDPFVDHALLAAVLKSRASKPRWEAAWQLRGDIRVAPGIHPLVFVNRRFVAGSVGFSEGLTAQTWGDFARRMISGPTLSVDRAILLRDSWDRNYWHLLHDVLSRLIMAEAIGIDPTIPVVVSERMMKRHGARLRETALLQSREVVVQPTEHILRCKELFLLRPSAIAAHWMPGVVARIPVESIPGAFPKHIYCRREPKSSTGRLAENALELEELFRSAGFTAIDPAEMSFGQQKAIFQQAEVIAGINGAAFANAIFRHDLPLSIGALMSANWISSLFPMVAKIFGFQYSGFVVPAVEDRIGASVLAPPETVHRLIERVLDRASRA